MAKSKSKTFPKGTDYGELIAWIGDHVGEATREIIGGWPDDYDVVYETDAKYLITITKLPEKGEK